MVNSQIQQGSYGSTQSVSLTQNELASIRDFVKQFEANLPELGLSDETETEARFEIATVEAQLASTNPKKGILRESLASVRNILEWATGSLVASELIPKLLPILASIAA